MTRGRGLSLIVMLVVGALIAAIAAASAREDGAALRPDGGGAGDLVIEAGPATVVVDGATRRTLTSDAAAAAWLAGHRRFSGRWTRGRLAWRGADAGLLAGAARGVAGRVRLAPVVREIALELPVIRQAYRNNCETAALSMALRGRVNQRRLQRLLRIDAPLDPLDGPGGRIWGDPSEGFVGRVAGGGFGVYEGPLSELGARFDAGTEAIRAQSFDEVMRLVRDGRPVVLWAALGASSPISWRTAEGKTVEANLAQHTIVLAGLNRNGVVVHDPWTGRVITESESALAARWRVLGRRAVATSARPATLITRR